MNITQQPTVSLATNKVSPPRAEKMVRMRVRMRNRFANLTSYTELTSADSNGYAEVVVYASDVPGILAQVESSHAFVEVAQQTHKSKWLRFVFEGIPDILERAERDPSILDKSKWTPAQIEKDQQYTGSFEAEFHSLCGRSPRKLLEAHVVEEGVLPPMSAELASAQLVLQGGGSSGMSSEVKSALEQLLAKVENLEVANAQLKAQIRKG